MPIPTLTDDGFLPPGIYDATLDEVGEVFGRFRVSDRRVTLFATLRRYIGDLQAWGNASAVLIDGSFASAAKRPNDIDLIVIYAPDFDLSAERAPEEYNVIDVRRIRRRYGLDVRSVAAGSPEEAQWIRFFGRDTRTGLKTKGLLRVTL
jgi:hypothetical protein